MLAANEIPESGRSQGGWGRGIMQSAHPRDVGALALVVGMFLILFVLSVILGTPTR
jgi:hypothetical protein